MQYNRVAIDGNQVVESFLKVYNKLDFDYLQREIYENNWINAHTKLMLTFW